MRTRSCKLLGSGREDLRDWIKAKARAIVKVLTDDAQIDLGYLIREDKGQIVVGTCQQETMYDAWQFGRRQRWVTLSIPRARIQEYAVLGAA